MQVRHLILILAACLPAGASAQLSDEALQCFQWFSTLGYPDVKDAKWAEIWTGSWSSSGGEDKARADTVMGFVTKEADGKFSALMSDLTTGTWKQSKPDTPSHERVGFEERPFLKRVEQQLQSLHHPPRDGFRRFGAKLGYKAEIFFFAYVCWQRGESDLAAQLYAEAQKLRSVHSGSREPGLMREDLEIDLGHAAMWDAVLRCGGGSLNSNLWGGFPEGYLEPRPSLLEAFRRILRLFPHCEHVERAKQSADMLERMIKEDEKHPYLTQKQIDQLPGDKRIAELVWLLRDQRGHQMSQPGSCDVFSMKEQGKTPAHQLLAIGYAAAPALIEALTDDRFSRSVGFHRGFYFSHTILTIGDCAQQILGRLSGQNFYSRSSTSGYMSNEEKMLEVQKTARKWWAEYQMKGKKQMLVDSIAAGKTSPGPLVQQLTAEAPEAVADAVLRGAKQAQSEWLLRQFIQQLGSLKNPAATQVLLTFMKKNEKRGVRLDAAAQLQNQAHPEALPAILHEWSIFPVMTQYDPEIGLDEMVELLIASGDAQAMQKLAGRWDDCPVYQRFEIVKIMGKWLRPDAIVNHFSSIKAQPLSPKAKEAAIKLLAHALEDVAARDGMSGGMGDFHFTNPRICDFALWALHRIDGSQYAFSPQAGRRQRDRERIAAANAWRTKHQQALLTLPSPLGPPLPEKEALKIVLVQIEPPKGFEDTPLIKHALELRGSSFSPTTISSLLISFASEQSTGIGGLRIEALRDSDLTGVEIHISLEPGDFPKDENRGWNTRHNGQFGSQNLSSSGGSCPLSIARKADFWKSFEEEITTELKSPPTTAFSLSAGLKASH